MKQVNETLSDDEEGQPKSRSCFFITPIGSPDSSERRAADGLLDAVLRPVAACHGYEVVPAHRIAEIGSITNQLLERIVSDDLVIADLTGLNENVMYELGVRHASMKPTIILAEDGTHLPFDMIVDRTIFYVNDFAGYQELIPALDQVFESLHERGAGDNPVSRAVQYNLVEHAVRQRDLGVHADSDFGEYILSRLDDLAAMIGQQNAELRRRLDFEGRNHYSSSVAHTRAFHYKILISPHRSGTISEDDVGRALKFLPALKYASVDKIGKNSDDFSVTSTFSERIGSRTISSELSESLGRRAKVEVNPAD
jgi:hypothetical protein